MIPNEQLIILSIPYEKKTDDRNINKKQNYIYIFTTVFHASSVPNKPHVASLDVKHHKKKEFTLHTTARVAVRAFTTQTHSDTTKRCMNRERKV